MQHLRPMHAERIGLMAKVIVVMSTYNGERWLQEQIESILHQQDCQVELLVRDDGSEEAQLSVLREYERCGKLRLICGENLKPAKSFLEAVKRTGEADFYAFSDQDDVWLPDKLSAAVRALEKVDNTCPNAYFCNLTAVDQNKKVLTPRLLPRQAVTEYRQILVRSPHVFGCTMVFNRALRDVIAERPLPRTLFMHDLWTALIAASMGKLLYDSEPHILYRQHGNNCVGATLSSRDKWKKRMQIIKKEGPCTMAEQAACFAQWLGRDILEQRGLYDYTMVVAGYPAGLAAKLRYIKTVNHKHMDFRQYIFHLLMVLTNRW